MTPISSALQAPVEVPLVLERCREMVRPALLEAVGRMHPWVSEMASYSFGWCEVGGAPAASSGGKGVRQALAVLGAEAVGALAGPGYPRRSRWNWCTPSHCSTTTSWTATRPGAVAPRSGRHTAPGPRFSRATPCSRWP